MGLNATSRASVKYKTFTQDAPETPNGF